MNHVLGLSILWAFLFCINFAQAQTKSVQSQKPSSKVTPAKKKVKKPNNQKPAFDVSFLEEAEDIEREAWWVLTGKRVDGIGSPLRVLRVAIMRQNPHYKTKIGFKFCQKMKVVFSENNTWRVEAECQKPSQEVGRLQKLADRKWNVEWRMGLFHDHFGLGATILYPRLSCEVQVALTGRIETMVCPLYARNRTSEEIVELKTFEYTAKDKSLLKLKGEVKKDLQVIATLQTEVPLQGDVVVKEKVLPQKPIEGSTDFTDSKPIPNTNATISEGTNGEEKNYEKEQSPKNNQENKIQRPQDQEIQNGHQEGNLQAPESPQDWYQEGGEFDNTDPTAVPPIEGPQPTDPAEISPTGR